MKLPPQSRDVADRAGFTFFSVSWFRFSTTGAQPCCRELSGYAGKKVSHSWKDQDDQVQSSGFIWRCDFILPELASVLLLLVIWQIDLPQLTSTPCKGGGLFLAAAFLIRLVWNSAILIHGLGHSIARALVDQKVAAISFSTIFENRSLAEFIQSLFPLSPIFLPFSNQQPALWVEVGDLTPWKVQLKASGGLLFNLVALWLVSSSGLLTDIPLKSVSDPVVLLLSQFSVIAFMAANGLILISSRSDMVAVVTGYADRFYCGNFGFIGCQEPVEPNELLPQRVIQLFRTMGYETEVRGAQAGGGLTFAQDNTGYTVFVGHKLVNPKRGHLTDSLESAFSRTRHRAVRTGVQSLPSSVIGAWHYRFGTSGPPSVLETHWHEWMPARIEQVWQIENSQWMARARNINHRISHNGDFSAWNLFSEAISTTRLGLWLERVLHTPNQTVGDSPKIAGMMDLLITQGMWFASVRLAYQLAIADSLEAAFGGHPPTKEAPNTAPSPNDLSQWANIFETVFLDHCKSLPDPNLLFTAEHLEQLQRVVAQQLTQDNQLGALSQPQLMNFTRVAIESFLDNDAYRANQIFMAKARGSFGLATLSTLSSDRLVLSALGQSITLGFNPQQGYTIYASEPAAIDATLAGQQGTYRLDLNQNAGEIAVLSASDLVIYSMSEDQELPHAELVQRQVPFQQHPYIHSIQPYVQTSLTPSADLIETDLQDIPRILGKIQDSWMDPTSLNRQSAEYLLNFLIAKARYLNAKQEKLITLGLDPTLAKSRHLDLLITGVENSLWLGEQFAKDLKAIFPLLSVKTLSSNQVLQDLQYDFESLRLAKQSIVLAISQSGQTFPTRQVLYACDLLVRQGIIREFFVLTGEPTSFIGSPLAQPTFSGESFSRRIFINHSGRRIAEPATASVAATHQTLTELLFYLVRQMHLAMPKGEPLGMRLSPEKLLVLKRMEDEFIRQSVPDILGATVAGQVQKTRLHRHLVQAGRRWALHITETPLAWGIQALYVLITVGWAIPFGYTIPLAQTLFKGALLAFQVPQDALIARIFASGLVFADVVIYIFGAWFWTLGLRLVQKRQLFARTGKRTLVIGDLPWVHQILKTYVSKLFSLSYGITSLEVHGANPQDHFLHHFGHRVVRGTLVFLGVPDGRCSQKHQSQESAVLMTGKQANGIQSLGTGPEIVALGSNPTIRHQGFAAAIVLPSPTHAGCEQTEQSLVADNLVETLRETRFGSFNRLLASYVFFWALAKRVANVPLLRYTFWKSQNRTKTMTTAAPVSAIQLDLQEPEEVSVLDLASVANREQS